MQIIRATQEHIPGMLELLRQVGQVHHRGRPDIFRSSALKYDAAALEALLRDEDRPIFIAEEEGRVLGYGFCKCNNYQGHSVFTGYRSCTSTISAWMKTAGAGASAAPFIRKSAVTRKRRAFITSH